MVRLADFPEHRRDWLLWLHAEELDYDGVEDLVAAAEHEPCRRRFHRSETASVVAVLGDDELYHLVAEGTVVCADTDRQHRQWKLAAGQHPHENTYIGGNIAPRQGFWVVRLTASTAPIHSVPPARRCPTFPARRLWPAHHNPETPLGRQHARLAAELGALCHGCRGAPAWAIDHDHFTGLVRGLLCRNCNTHIDECLHLSGCPWADYLNNPPAAALGLRYCQSGRRRRRLSVGNLRRIEALGFNPLA